MKNWTNSIALALMAATFTLAGCTEDSPANMTEAEPETPEAFDTETVYELVPRPRIVVRGVEQAVFVQFVSEEAKRALDEMYPAGSGQHFVPLSAERAAQVWDNKRLVYVMAVPGEGRMMGFFAHVYNPESGSSCLREGGCSERGGEVGKVRR